MKAVRIDRMWVLGGTIHAAWDESVFAIKYHIPEGRRVLMILLRPEDL